MGKSDKELRIIRLKSSKANYCDMFSLVEIHKRMVLCLIIQIFSVCTSEFCFFNCIINLNFLNVFYSNVVLRSSLS